MPKDTKTLGNNKARACESLGFVHKKRLCQRFDTTSFGLPISNYHPFILLFTSFCRLMLQRYQGWYKIVYGLVSFVSTCDEMAQK
jgi:hypothetical protein